MAVRILIGDCREQLKTLPDESVHCVVTSPPYWGLRDYGVAGQLGLERCLGDHVEVMTDVFRDVRRVLRKDGTLWLNYGDSYANNGCGGGSVFDNGRTDGRPFYDGDRARGREATKNSRIPAGLKPKDLCGVPWRVAFALQADGWWLRQDIIWSKPNPMPESIRDRCTKAHEYIFLLSKSERYYFDGNAIAEVALRAGEIPGGSKKHTDDGVNDMRIRQGLEVHSKNAVSETRNKRSVWEIATAPFSEAHFATFPPALIEPCIKAGTSEKGCCAKCGAPWGRETAKEFTATSDGSRNITGQDFMQGWAGVPRGNVKTETLGWSPSCRCDAATVSCTVLDPFGGAGTTGLVADRLQRNAILIELNPEYAAMADRRIRGDAPLMALIGS